MRCGGIFVFIIPPFRSAAAIMLLLLLLVLFTDMLGCEGAAGIADDDEATDEADGGEATGEDGAACVCVCV